MQLYLQIVYEMKTCLLFFALLNSYYCLGQYERVWPTTDIQKCEGDTFIIKDNIAMYNKVKTSYDENCIRRNEYNEANLEEFVVEGIEVIERNTTKYFCGESCSYEVLNFLKFVARKNTKITIYSVQRQEISYANQACNPNDTVKVITFKDIFTYNLKIYPKNSKPSLSVQTTTTNPTAPEIVQITADGCDNNEGTVWSSSDPNAFSYYNSTNVINVNNTYECLEYKAKCYNRYCPQYPPNWSDPLSTGSFKHTQSDPGYSPTFSNYLNNQTNKSIGKPEYAYRRQLSCLQQKSNEEYDRTGENGWGGGFTKHLFDRFAKENTCEFSANRPCRFDCQTGCILDIGFEKHSRELFSGFASYIPSVSLLSGSIANWTIQHEAFLANAVSACFNELNNDPNYHKCFIDTETLKSIVQENARLLRIFMQFLANPTPIGQIIVNFQLIRRSITQAISDSDLNQVYNYLPNPLTQAQLFSQQALNSSQLKVTAGNNFFIKTNSSVQLNVQPISSATITYQLSVDTSIATVDANGLLTVHSTTEPLINGRLPFYVIATSNGQTGIGQFAIYDTDNDQDMISDTYEQRIGLNPMVKNDLKSDLDGDDLLDVFEVCLGSNPLKQDTDGDGFSDLAEYLKGTILNLASSYPNPPQISSVSSGDWHATTTWSCNCIPTKFEEVTINDGHTVTISLQNAETQRLFYNGGSVKLAMPNSHLYIGLQK